MNLFQDGETAESFRSIWAKASREIERLTNEEICSTDLGELEEYYVIKYQIEEIVLLRDNTEHDLSETKIQVPNRFYHYGYSQFESQYAYVDGYKVTFSIPFDGDEDLLKLRPSTFYVQEFPVDKIVSPTRDEYGKLVYSMEFRKEELQTEENVIGFVKKRLNQEMQNYYKTIETINQEVRTFNIGLPKIVKECLNKRLQKANDYIQLRERMELPLKLNPSAPNTKPIVLKKVKKQKEVAFPNKKAPEKNYEISDANYENIKNIILLACTSMEKTARTFSKLWEEELRDVILSNLNTHYYGTASGETFNKIGKTDIYIPFENKAAYIAECKIWHGSKKFEEAIEQLCSYTTWRETKTSLIIFNKENKDFEVLLNNIEHLLTKSERCKQVVRLEHNQWQGVFIKEAESRDILTINIMVYDLYIKE